MPDTWELVDATGKRRATGTYEHCADEFYDLAEAELQNKVMTPGFTLRRVRSKVGRKPKPVAA